MYNMTLFWYTLKDFDLAITKYIHPLLTVANLATLQNWQEKRNIGPYGTKSFA